VRAGSVAFARAGPADYLEVSKPRLTALVLATTLTGAWLGSGGAAAPGFLLQTVLATALVAAGASALNQLAERRADALMRRTANRPLAAGRMQPAEALAFGLGTIAAGLAWLAAATNLAAAALAAFTAAAYVLVYTPLKSRTTLNTLVGAVPGALPTLIGWAAARGRVDGGAWVLFSILYLWQIPHFLSIAWLYREDYARAGMRMLPVVDPAGGATGRQALLHAAGTVLVSLTAFSEGLAGGTYLAGAVLLGAAFLGAAGAFAFRRSDGRARALMRASLLYLPLLLGLMAFDHA